MSKELETTYYRFQSEVRAFLSKLLKNPVDAQPSKYLKDREFTRKKLIDELLKRDVIERHEKILDRTNSDEKEAKYVVKFKVHKKDFEKRIHRIYIKFFEKNVNESVEEMQAYHGSPKKFNRFKNSRVGKHNFYGWGTYVSFDYEQGKRYARGNGYFYEVSIPDDNGTNYLHIREERPEVYDWVYSILKQELPKFSSSFYGVIEKCKKWKDFTPLFGWEMEPIEKQISKALEKHGIIGLMVVPDQPYCVIFNAKNVKIMNRARVAESVNEEAELRSCANVIGVVGGGKPGETADRWAKYVNGNENGFKRQVFSNEDDMKKRILNGPDGDVYRKRGGINEEGEGGGMAAGGDGSGGATSTSSVASETTRGDLGYDVPFKEVQRRGIYVGAQGEKRSTNPILGKTITAEAKKGRRIFITEEQYEMILKEEGLGAGGATTTTSVASETTRGDLGYDVPFLGKANGKSKSKFLKPAMDREPGFSVERMK